MSQPNTNGFSFHVMSRVRTAMFCSILLLDASFSLFGMCALGVMSSQTRMIMIGSAGGIAGLIASYLIVRFAMSGGVRIPVTKIQRRLMLRTLMFSLLLCCLWLVQYTRFPESRGSFSLSLYLAVVTAGTIYSWNQARAYTVQKLQDPVLRNVKTYENDSRFYMVAEKYHINSDGTFTVMGEASGSIGKGDKLYLYSDPLQFEKITVTDCLNEGNTSVRGRYQASLILPISSPDSIKAFTVLSSVRYYPFQTAETPVENPYLTGMAMSFHHMKEKAGYVDQMFRAVAYGRYLVSIERRNKDKTLRDRIDDLFMEDTDFSYGIPVLTFEKGTYFPIYSSWDALKRYQGYKKNDTAVMTFQNIVKIVTENNGQIVLDPFGPGATYFSDQFIQDIINSPGYKHDFNAWEGTTLRDKMRDYMRTLDTHKTMNLADAVLLFEKMCSEVKLPDALEEGKSVSIDLTTARDRVLIRLKRNVFRMTGDEEEASVVISMILKDGERADCLEIQENRKYSFQAMMEQLQVYRDYKSREIDDISVE